ncbi:MAG: GNAT family N-acetyltransferase [Pseudomonadota bacterium]
MTNAAAPILETERLVLRPHRLSDFDPLYTLFASERAEYMGGPFSAKTMWYWIAAEVGSWTLQGFGSWGLEQRSDGAFIGQIGINKPHHFPEPELGWVLLHPFEGRGYAFEAAQAARDWYWNTTGATTLVSYVHSDNTRSKALAARLGARPDPDAPFAAGDTAEDTTVFRHRREVAA